MLRHIFVWLHRWVGLLLAGFLVIVGLTGSLITFNSELERLISPQLYAMPRPGVAPLDLGALAARAEALVPEGRIGSVYLKETDQAIADVAPRLNPATGEPFALGFDQLFLDPWTGKELGRRMNGDISQGWINLMPFIYDLHWRLALGTTGFWILGIIALIWTIDCFVGFYLTLPVALESFWQRWKPAWLVKWGAGAFRLNFDLHRASGLWLWPMLFIFAWSSVLINLKPVYIPVTRALFDFVPPWGETAPDTPRREGPPRLDWRAAETVGARLMAEQAKRKGFSVAEASNGLSYDADTGAYFYTARSSLDISYDGETSVQFDGDTGALISLDLPKGEHSGNTVTNWLYALHMARVFGLPYRIFVCVLGLVITMLSVTGIYIWWKKRRARKFSKTHRGVAAEILHAEAAE